MISMPTLENQEWGGGLKYFCGTNSHHSSLPTQKVTVVYTYICLYQFYQFKVQIYKNLGP